MQQSLTYAYIALLVLTLTVAALASLQATKFLLIAIVVFSLIKFWLVGFAFLELKRGHLFWQVLLVLFGLVIGGAFIVLL